MRIFLNVASLIAWCAAAVTWTGRVHEYHALLKKPVPRWAIVITIFCWVSVAITTLSTFFAHLPWTSPLMSVLWFVCAVVVLFTTVTSGKEAQDGKEIS